MGDVKKGFKSIMSNPFSLDPLGLLTPEMPKVEDPKVAPDIDDKEAKGALSRKMQRKYSGKGRASTVLSGSESLG